MDPFPASTLFEPTAGLHANENHLHDDGFRAYAFRFDRPLAARRFQDFIDRKVPAGVFRGKGIVRFEGPQAYVYHLCGSRSAFEPYPHEVPECQLVFIGRDVDRDSLERDLKACLLRMPAAASQY